MTWLTLWNICVTNDHGYVPLVVNTPRSFPHSRLITGFITRLTRRVPLVDQEILTTPEHLSSPPVFSRVPLVEQELLTIPEHLSSPPVFSRVRVARSLALCVCFVDRYLSFCTCSFGHCFVCSSSIYGFWLPLWYLHILLAVVSVVFLLAFETFLTLEYFYVFHFIEQVSTVCVHLNINKIN